MKHRFTIPSEIGAPRLHEWLHGRGWHVAREELQHTWGQGVWLHATIVPFAQRDADRPSYTVIHVSSGATLIYDDVEQSMGVTVLAEPRDAVPVALAEPEDARPA